MRLDISTKVSLTIVAAFVVLVSALLGIVATSSLNFAKQQAVAQQEANMRVAWDALRAQGSGFRREGDRLMIGDHVLNGDEALVDHVKQLVGGVTTVFMGDTRVATNVMHPDGRRAVGTTLAKGPVYDAVLARGEAYRGEAEILGVPYFVAYDPIKNASGETIGILFVAVTKADYLQPVYHQLIWLAGSGLVLGLAGVAASVMVARRQLRPLQDIRAAMAKVMGGNLDVALPFAGRHDDVGLMADAVHAFRDDAKQKADIEADAARLRAEAESERARAEEERRGVEAAQVAVVETLAASLERLAQGDLTTRIEAQFDGSYAQIKADFNAAADSLSSAMGAISHATGGVRGGSDEIAAASDDLSRRTEQQAASLEETAAALDEITATVSRSVDGASQAASAASETRMEAARSGEVVREAVAAMGEIEESSGEIAQIIGVIDEIAFQTNLLALNAGVEAARAGEAGRGFAVVASEVRALAQRSAEAAKEIKTLIATSSAQVERGVRLVGDTGEALAGIVTKVSEIDVLISEIAKSAREQATALNQVNIAVNQMDQVTQQNAAMVEEATAAAANLRTEADDLSTLVERFNLGATEAAYPGEARRNIAA